MGVIVGFLPWHLQQPCVQAKILSIYSSNSQWWGHIFLNVWRKKIWNHFCAREWTEHDQIGRAKLKYFVSARHRREVRWWLAVDVKSGFMKNVWKYQSKSGGKTLSTSGTVIIAMCINIIMQYCNFFCLVVVIRGILYSGFLYTFWKCILYIQLSCFCC